MDAIFLTFHEVISKLNAVGESKLDIGRSESQVTPCLLSDLIDHAFGGFLTLCVMSLISIISS